MPLVGSWWRRTGQPAILSAALAWLGPDEVVENLETLEHKLSPEDIEELAATRAVMPAWLAESVSAMVADA